MAFIRGRGLRLALSTLAASTSIAGTSFLVLHLWTRRVAFEPFSFQNSNVAHHPGLQTLRLESKSTFCDSFVLEAPFENLRPDLVQDALAGGTKLIERFAAGVWGGYAFCVQRNLMKFFRKDETKDTDLWEVDEIRQSRFNRDTILADDFIVVDKTAASMTLHGGESPRKDPREPRHMDTIVVLRADVDTKNQVVRFRLQCVVAMDRSPAGKAAPLGPVEILLHQQYSRLLVNDGAHYCMTR